MIGFRNILLLLIIFGIMSCSNHKLSDSLADSENQSDSIDETIDSAIDTSSEESFVMRTHYNSDEEDGYKAPYSVEGWRVNENGDTCYFIACGVHESDSVYFRTDEMAEFQGGNKNYYKWVSDNLRYPEEKRRDSIQQRIYVRLVIDSHGSIVDTKFMSNHYEEEFKEESLRLIKMMPKWKPAKNQGKPVPSYFNIPIVFRLDKNLNPIAQKPL